MPLLLQSSAFHKSPAFFQAPLLLCLEQFEFLYFSRTLIILSVLGNGRSECKRMYSPVAHTLLPNHARSREYSQQTLLVHISNSLTAGSNFFVSTTKIITRFSKSVSTHLFIFCRLNQCLHIPCINSQNNFSFDIFLLFFFEFRSLPLFNVILLCKKSRTKFLFA